MMSETEIRGVIWSFDEPIHYLTAIPWCTTHNAQRSGDNYCWVSVDYDAFPNVRDADCEFSQGGPEHKWWKDE